MGIRSLWKVSWVNSRRVNASRGEIEEGLRGKMLAVDFALLCHRFGFGFRLQNQERDPDGVLKGFLRLCVRAALNSTHLVFCFDGKSSELKKIHARADREASFKKKKKELKELKAEVQERKERKAKREENEEETVKRHCGMKEAEVLVEDDDAVEELQLTSLERDLFAQASAPFFEAAVSQSKEAAQASAPIIEAPLLQSKEAGLLEHNVVVKSGENGLLEQGVNEDELVANSSDKRLQELVNKKERQLRISMTEEIFVHLTEMFQLFGFTALQCAGEAEKTAACLSDMGIVDGIYTTDGDAIAYGARRVYRDVFSDKVSMFEFEREDRILACQAALILGSDLNGKGIHKMGPVKLEGLLKEFQLNADISDDVERCLDPLRRFKEWFEDKSTKSHSSLRSKLKEIFIDPEFLNEAVVREFLVHNQVVTQIEMKPRASIAEILAFRKRVLPTFDKMDDLIVQLSVENFTANEKEELVKNVFSAWIENGSLSEALAFWMSPNQEISDKDLT